MSALVGSAGVSQGLALAATPLLLVLYHPAEFGVFAMTAMAATLLGTLAALRYERGVILARRDADAARLLRICFVLGGLASGAGGVLALAVPGGGLTPQEAMLAAAFAFLTSLNASCAAALGRQRRFQRLAAIESLASVATVVAHLAAGFALLAVGADPWWQSTALLGGAVFGRAAWGVVALQLLWAQEPATVRPRRLRRLLLRYWKLPAFSAPYALVTNLQWRGLLLIAAGLGGAAAAGQVAIALRLVFTPVSAVGAALRRVTLPDLSEHRDAPWMSRRAAATIGWLGWAVLPLAVGVAVASGPIAGSLPAEWRGAMVYLVALLPAALAMTFTCWLDQAYEALDRQGLALSLEAGSSLGALGVAGVAGWGGGLAAAIAAYAAALAIYNGFWLAFTWRLLRWPHDELRRAALKLAKAACLLCPAFLLAPISVWLAGLYLIGASCLETGRIASVLHLLLRKRRYA